MDAQKSHIVVSIAGRDKGKHFFVLDREGEYVILADGKWRKLESPKRKKLRHVRFAGESDSKIARKIRDNEKVLNSELRKALAEFTIAAGNDQGGT